MRAAGPEPYRVRLTKTRGDEVTDMNDDKDQEFKLPACATLVLAASALCAANQLRVMAASPPPSSEYLDSGRQMLHGAVHEWIVSQPDPEEAHTDLIEVGEALFADNAKEWPGVTS